MARAGDYLWRLSFGRPLWPDALAVFIEGRAADCELCALLELFRKCEGGISGRLDHLALRYQRPFHTTANGRLSSVDFGIAAVTSRAHAKSPLVFFAAAAFCILGELPWNVFSRRRHWSWSSSLFSNKFSAGTARPLIMGFAHAADVDVSVDALDRGVVA